MDLPCHPCGGTVASTISMPSVGRVGAWQFATGLNLFYTLLGGSGNLLVDQNDLV